MDTNNTVKLKGTYNFEIKDVDGNIKDSWKVDNAVMTVGFAQLALLCGDASAVPFTYLAVGTDATAVSIAQTALVAEIVDSGLERAAGTVSRITTTGANDTYKITYTWTATGSKTIEEVGVFNDASAGTMLSRALTTSKAISSGETLTGTYTLKFA
jgi:hypothetical protein